MPKLTPVIKDTKPDIAKHTRDVLQRMRAGKNIASEFNPDAGYVFEPTDAYDMRTQLPAQWDTAPLRLIKRSEHDGAVRSVYRVVHDGDTRIMLVELDTSGELLNLALKADPDNR